MRYSKRLDAASEVKLLSDPRRLAIIRRLMRAPATLSQLGQALDASAARVRHHLKVLEAEGLVELVETRPVRGFTAKYYRASARAYFINRAILPTPSPTGTIYVIGSHDPALELLAEVMGEQEQLPEVLPIPVGSLDGLWALRQGFCQLAGCHLYDPIGENYNQSFVRHFFPGQSMELITLAHREQGLVVAPENPLSIRGLTDLARSDVQFVNRRAGSGTRTWLDQRLQELKMEPDRIRGYENEVNTHGAVVEMVKSGRADVGLAVLATAEQGGMSFIPLFEERFDLVLSQSALADPLITPLLAALNDGRIIGRIGQLAGYRLTETGQQVPVN